MSKSFPIEALGAFPPPGMALPNHFTFSATDDQIRYLASTLDEPNQRLFALTVASGAVEVLAVAPNGGTQEASLSPEEELRRQRERMLTVGITGYSVHEASGRIL
ncbi:MAG: hypothetical protein H0X24_07655, partial [Ktedonobacterales bacterium]|nr:hypothetical protein [Ktedonobacterales bacterium]